MRRMILVGAVSLVMPVFSAASNPQPLSVKTGLWQVTMSTRVNGMAAQTMTYKSCVTKDDLSKYPFTDPDNNCSYTVSSSTGSQMEAHGSCAPGSEGKVTFNLQLQAVDSENVKGTGHLTMTDQGVSMNGDYSVIAKWAGASCSAGMK